MRIAKKRSELKKKKLRKKRKYRETNLKQNERRSREERGAHTKENFRVWGDSEEIGVTLRTISLP